MQAEAIFENIVKRIKQELNKSQKSIFVVANGFANEVLFKELYYKAKKGCNISLAIYHDKEDKKLGVKIDKLRKYDAHIFELNSLELDEDHENFCVIDFDTVITGSYSWGDIIKSSLENVIITNNDTILAGQFISKFNNILSKYFPSALEVELDFPIDEIVRRLEIFKNCIILEDIDELKQGIGKIKSYDFNTDVREIIENVEKENFAIAINKIQSFISKNQLLSIWIDPEIAGIKLEIKSLENQVTAFENERIDLEKVLAEFEHQHTIVLGGIILEILKLRKLKYKSDEEKYEEAVNDEEQYQQQFIEETEKEINELNGEQKAELKRNFRKATMLCHPDKFVNESIKVQQQTENIFKELNEANAKNDLERVSEILEYLVKGELTTPEGDKLSDKDELRIMVERLRKKIKTIETEIIGIIESETYNTILNIENWEEYFKSIKVKLQKELEQLKNEIQ